MKGFSEKYKHGFLRTGLVPERDTFSEMVGKIVKTQLLKKTKILVCRKWSKIRCLSSLGSVPKEDVKNHFHSFQGDFGHKVFFEKKVPKYSQK